MYGIKMTDCWFCGHEMIWGADFNADEVGLGSDKQVAAELSCPNCGATATFVSAADEEDDAGLPDIR